MTMIQDPAWGEVPLYHLEIVRDRSVSFKRVTPTANAAAVLHDLLDKSPVEQFVVIYLSSMLEMIGCEKISLGSVEYCVVPIADTFRGAIKAASPRIILGHCHPLGPPTPSDQDIVLTSRLSQAGAILGIEIWDHVIVSPDGTHYSFFDNQADMANRIAVLEQKAKILDAEYRTLKYLDKQYGTMGKGMK